MNSLVEWYRAQLDEDARVARDAHYEGQRWLPEEEDVFRWPGDELVYIADRKRDAAHIARYDPARVLRDVAAKRAIVDAFATIDGGRVRLTDAALHLQWNVLRAVVQHLASVYDDRPGYLEEWRP